MIPLRKLVRIDEANRTASRNVDTEVFWDELVAEIAEAWSREDVRFSYVSWILLNETLFSDLSERIGFVLQSVRC